VNNFAGIEKEIFVQDLKNNIYLINKNGRILWKKQIQEKISSNIFTIDFYIIKRPNWFFSSLNYIFVVDLIGNNIDHYPLKLPFPFIKRDFCF